MDRRRLWKFRLFAFSAKKRFTTKEFIGARKGAIILSARSANPTFAWPKGVHEL
jgi:hypothetical protein